MRSTSWCGGSVRTVVEEQDRRGRVYKVLIAQGVEVQSRAARCLYQEGGREVRCFAKPRDSRQRERERCWAESESERARR